MPARMQYRTDVTMVDEGSAWFVFAHTPAAVTVLENFAQDLCLTVVRNDIYQCTQDVRETFDTLVEARLNVLVVTNPE